MKFIVSAKEPPVNGAECRWVRSLDPWHRDAFPEGLQHAGSTGKRKEGWMGEDWCGNPIWFIPDGHESDTMPAPTPTKGMP